ncbi:MAG: peroxiredoxin [Candidatus Thorarchaeota archaeon]|jgi:peroxiredoxin Q/BCP
MIKEGDSAASFSLKDRNGKTQSLNDIDSEFVVVYFYPKDNTPGCTLEARAFNKDLDEFRKLNTTVIGISGGDEKSKTRFCEKNKLTITLLSDSDFSVSKKYGVFAEKSLFGKRFPGIKRMTFVLAGDRNVIKVFRNVNPVTHSREVLTFIQNRR